MDFYEISPEGRDYTAEREVRQRLDRLERMVDAIARNLLEALAGRGDPGHARVFMDEVGNIMHEYAALPYKSNRIA